VGASDEAIKRPFWFGLVYSTEEIQKKIFQIFKKKSFRFLKKMNFPAVRKTMLAAAIVNI
jgi:hypothetical protein